MKLTQVVFWTSISMISNLDYIFMPQIPFLFKSRPMGYHIVVQFALSPFSRDTSKSVAVLQESTVKNCIVQCMDCWS